MAKDAKKAKTPNPPDHLLRGVGFTLGQLYRSSREVIDGPLEAEGHTLRTYWVLSCLRARGELSQQQVCDALGIDRSDMVRIVDTLERRGLVTRTRDTKDRRRHLLTLTKEGQAARKRVADLVDSATSKAFDALSPFERRLLHRLALKALGQPQSLAKAR